MGRVSRKKLVAILTYAIMVLQLEAGIVWPIKGGHDPRTGGGAFPFLYKNICKKQVFYIDKCSKQVYNGIKDKERR